MLKKNIYLINKKINFLNPSDLVKIKKNEGVFTPN